MIDQQMIDYIKSLQEKGISDETIKNHLLKYNYSLDLINECFNEINKNKKVILNAILTEKNKIGEKNQETKKEDNKKKNKNSKIIIFIIITIIFISLFSFFLFTKFDFSNLNLNNLNLIESEKCKNSNLDFFKAQENEILCVFPDNNNVQMILENKGENKIDKIDVYLNNQLIETLDINLMPEQILTKNIINNKIKDKITSIKLIPYIEGNKCKEIKRDSLRNC